MRLDNMLNFFQRKKQQKQEWAVVSIKLDAMDSVVKFLTTFTLHSEFSYHLGIVFPFSHFPDENEIVELTKIEEQYIKVIGDNGFLVASIFNPKFKEIDFYIKDKEFFTEARKSTMMNFSRHFVPQFLIEDDINGDFYYELKKTIGTRANHEK